MEINDKITECRNDCRKVLTELDSAIFEGNIEKIKVLEITYVLANQQLQYYERLFQVSDTI